MTAEQTLKIVKRVDSPWFGVIVDTGYFLQGDPYKEIEAVAPYAVNWQVKTHIGGKGAKLKSDLQRIVKIAHASGYRGYLPIETLPVAGEEYDPRVRVQQCLRELARRSRRRSKTMARLSFFALGAILMLGLAGTGQETTPQGEAQKKKKSGSRPPVRLTYHVAAIADAADRDRLRLALLQVKSLNLVLVGARGDQSTVQFDSHVVSYHQVAQAITNAGARVGKQYAPYLKLRVPEYAAGRQRRKGGCGFRRQRLNQRVPAWSQPTRRKVSSSFISCRSSSMRLSPRRKASTAVT